MSLLNDASLVMIPSGYKDTKLYSVKPTNGDGDFTFSRGSNLAATRVNSEGLIEKGRENLLLQSNQFDTTWSTTSASVTGGQSGYDGTNDAWLLDESAAGGRVFQSISGSGVMTFSMYVKSGSLDYVLFYVNTTSSDPYAYFDLANGLVGNTSAEIDATIVSAGNGYYRCSVTGNVGTLSAIEIYPANSTSTHTTAAGSIYIQDSQLEQGLISTPYIETGASTAQAGILEDMPRLDYSGGASCPSLLLEPQRTNLLANSEYFGGHTLINVTATANNSISPEGLINAYKITESNSSGEQTGYLEASCTSGNDYTVSIFAKANTRNWFFLRFGGANGVFANTYAWFNLSDGTTGTIQSGITASIEDYGNGWYRLIITRSAIATATGRFFWGLADANGSTSYTGNGNSNLYVYGFQTEQASYPTSYIPTYGASVTRGVDFSDNNDIVSNPISFGANDNFTLFYEGSFDDLSSTSNMIMGGGNKSVGNAYKNYWWVQNATSIRITGDSEVLMASASMSLTDNTNHKLLVKRDGSIIDFFVDGSKLTTTQSTPNTAFVFRSLGWSYTNAVYKVSGDIKQALIFNSALSDDECEQLTTL